MSPPQRLFMDALVVNALVKLRQRIDGAEIRLTQAEAQALYLAVLLLADLPERAAG